MDQLKHLRQRMKHVESLIVQGKALDVEELEPSIHSSDSVENIITGYPNPPLNQGGESNLRLSDLLKTLLQSQPGEIYETCRAHFQQTHKWFPVVSERLFYKRLTAFSQTHSADFALLLFTIVLFSRFPQEDFSEAQTADDPLYKMLKSNYWRMSTNMKVSIELVQAGLLLACYEHCSGMIDAAYLTLGMCARLGQWMDLDKKKDSGDPIHQETDAWFQNCEKINLWWGIVIRDRCLAIEHPVQDKSFAVQSLPEYAPVDHDFIRPYLATPDGEPEKASLFSLQAQACDLLDQTIRFRRQYAIASQKSRAVADHFNKLDQDIQSILRSVLIQNEGFLSEYCETIAIVIA
ncbi:hypothetical protein ACHAQJ_005494 [Trichoderma viride]